MAVKETEEVAAKRTTAAYRASFDLLVRTREDLNEKEMDELALQAVDLTVFGFDAKRDRKGNYIQQGIGSPGHETSNHFASILRWQGKQAYDEAVAEIWKRDPKRAEKLRLPKPVKAA